MNRSLEMLHVLKDGRWHSRRDLFDQIGFCLLNNAASELRARGYAVEKKVERVNGDNVYFYRLGSLDEVDAEQQRTDLLSTDGAASTSSRDSASLSAASSLEGSHDPQDGGREQESLFTYPRTPEWS